MKAALVSLPAADERMRCTALRLPAPDRFEARFEAGDDWIEVTVVPRDSVERAFAVLDRVAVRYRGQVRERSEVRRQEIQRLVRGVAEPIDRRLGEGARDIATALGRPEEPRRLRFDRDGLLALLGPEVRLGEELTEGWVAQDVYPTSHISDALERTLELVLELRREGEAPLRVTFGRRRDDRPSFGQGEHLAMSYLTGGREPPGASTALSLLAFLLALRDDASLEVEVPAAHEVLPPRALPAGPAEDDAGVLNLAIDAACAQACAFCAVQRVRPPIDPKDETRVARLRADLRSNRAAGVRRLRLNGYDPLAHPAAVDLLEEAKSLGYRHVTVFSPCTRLADAEFRARVVDALPEGRLICVPVYGASAEVHDAVVGRPGAFELVRAAIDGLREALERDELRLTTVVVKENLRELGAISALARTLGLEHHAQLAYPTTEAADDPWRDAAPTFTEVAEELARLHREGAPRPVEVRGLVPCVLKRAMGDAPVLDWLHAPDEPPLVPGTESRNPREQHRAREITKAAFHSSTVPCPHTDRCALRPACPAEVLRSQAERDGLDELAPVGLRELLTE